MGVENEGATISWFGKLLFHLSIVLLFGSRKSVIIKCLMNIRSVLLFYSYHFCDFTTLDIHNDQH